MQPIHELLNRIRWDPDFGKANFDIGYYDRVERRMIRVSFRRLFFPRDDHFVFEVADAWGLVHRVPYHRVHQVFRNGELIWDRPLH